MEAKHLPASHRCCLCDSKIKDAILVIYLHQLSVIRLAKLSKFFNKANSFVPIPKELQLNKHDSSTVLKPSKPRIYNECNIGTQTFDK